MCGTVDGHGRSAVSRIEVWRNVVQWADWCRGPRLGMRALTGRGHLLASCRALVSMGIHFQPSFWVSWILLQIPAISSAIRTSYVFCKVSLRWEPPASGWWHPRTRIAALLQYLTWWVFFFTFASLALMLTYEPEHSGCCFSVVVF